MNDIQILLVEDDPDVALTVEVMIDNLGYKLINTLDNSEDAIFWIKKSTPDIVVLDISIKGNLSGIDVAQKAVNEFIPIIFITGHQEREIFNEAQKVLPVAYLVNPFNKLSLQAAIQNAIRPLKHKSVSVHSSVYNNDLEEQSESVLRKWNKL